jgi:hypothetical protein
MVSSSMRFRFGAVFTRARCRYMLNESAVSTSPLLWATFWTPALWIYSRGGCSAQVRLPWMVSLKWTCKLR